MSVTPPTQLLHVQLEANLVQKVLPNAEGGDNITTSWGDLGLLSHSLGADTLIQMLRQNKSFAKVRLWNFTYSKRM